MKVYDDPNNNDFVHFQSFKIDEDKDISILSIVLDKEIVWALTRSGIYKFNGVTFSRTLSFEEEEIENIPDKMLVDHMGNLWLYKLDISKAVASSIIYDIREGKLKDITDIPSLAPYVDKIRHDVMPYNDLNQNIWFRMNDGRYFKYASKFEFLSFPNPSGNHRIFEVGDKTFISDKSGTKLFEGNNLLCQIKTSRSNPKIVKGKRYDYHIYDFDEDLKSRKIYLIKDHNLVDSIIFELNHQNIQSYKIIYHEESDRIIMSSGNNINFFDRELQKIGRTVSNEFITTGYCIDNHDNIWMASSYGIVTISPKKNKFNILNKHQQQSIRSIKLLGDSILQYASYQGFNTLDLNSGKLLQQIPEFFSYDRVDLNDTLSLFSTTTNLLHYGQTSESGRLTLLDNPIKTEEEPSVNNLYLDKANNNLWAGGLYHLIKIDLNNIHQQTVFKNTVLRTRDIQDFNSQILVASENGLFRLDENETIYEIPYKGENIECNDIHPLNEKEFIVSRVSRGLEIYDENFVPKDTFRSEVGITSKIIYSILTDQRGNFWCGTDAGLMYLNREKRTVRYFTEKDGVGQDDFNYNASYKHPDGSMFFGGTSRLIHFHPDTILMNNPVKKIMLKDANYRSRNSEVYRPIYDLRNLFINHGQPELVLHFGLENPLSGIEPELEYNINETTWQKFDKGTLILKELPYGDNKITVRSSLDNSSWYSVNVSSQRPFYLKTWFGLLGVLAFLGILFLINILINDRLKVANLRLEEEVSKRTEEIIQKNAALIESNKTKDKIFSVLSHDLKSPLTSLTNIAATLNFLIKERRFSDIEMVSKEIQTRTNNMKLLIDNLLHWSLQQQDEVYLADVTFKLIGPVEEAIKQFDELLRDKQLDIHVDINPLHQVRADYGAFQMITRNLIHNALKYSYKEGRILIRTNIQDDSINLMIEDDGVGMDAVQMANIKEGKYLSTIGPYSEKGTGLGLSLAKFFAEKMGGNLKFIPKKEGGTKVILMLAINANVSMPVKQI